MKALSLGLVKGQIDGVDGRVHMTWVQPRVLDLQQVGVGWFRGVGWGGRLADEGFLYGVRREGVNGMWLYCFFVRCIN